MLSAGICRRGIIEGTQYDKCPCVSWLCLHTYCISNFLQCGFKCCHKVQKVRSRSTQSSSPHDAPYNLSCWVFCNKDYFDSVRFAHQWLGETRKKTSISWQLSNHLIILLIRCSSTSQHMLTREDKQSRWTDSGQKPSLTDVFLPNPFLFFHFSACTFPSLHSLMIARHDL